MVSTASSAGMSSSQPEAMRCPPPPKRAQTSVAFMLPSVRMEILKWPFSSCRSVAEALVSSDAPVVELAINAGFNNTHSFYSAFRSCYNMTPREYLAQYKRSGKPQITPSLPEMR